MKLVLTIMHPIVRHTIHSVVDCIDGVELIGEVESFYETINLIMNKMPDVLIYETTQTKNYTSECRKKLLSSIIKRLFVSVSLDPITNKVFVDDVIQRKGNEVIRIGCKDLSPINPSLGCGSCTGTWIEKVSLVSLKEYSTLTDREIEVLQKLSCGKTNHEIGMDLIISDRTVRQH